MQFLSFSLTLDNKAILPTANLVEVFNVDPGLIVPIPDMPPGVMGACNWRGQVLWLVDLAYLLGLGAMFDRDFHYPKHSVLIVRSQGKLLGLAVNEVGRLMQCDPAQFQPVPISLLPQMQVFTSCIQGQIIDAEGKSFLALDTDAIGEFLAKYQQRSLFSSPL